MKKYIYKITNIINDKKYIGQTINPIIRWKQHQKLGNGNTKNSLLYKAMQKYGIENFVFEVIEGPIENYNEREIYWIKKYNTYIGVKDSWGYNLTEGGEDPPHPQGVDHHYCTHSSEEILQIKYLISKTKLPFSQIAKTFNYNISSIERINKGEIWNNSLEQYPLRAEGTKNFAKERADNIKKDLLYSNLTQKEIAQKYGLGRTSITAINNGQNFFDEHLNYPLRKSNRQKKAIIMLDKNTKEILQEFTSAKEASIYLGKNTESNITACARGEIPTAYGYIWKYKENK